MASFTFIDLFAGIGGFHIALHSIGGKCVFASEIDDYARKTYEYNLIKITPELFESGMFKSDIRTVSPGEIPDFDVLCAGFPCQPFSQAGYKRGFTDTHKSERGNLFFNILDIIEFKRPRAFFLENVRGIITHDSGNTFKVIKESLQNLGYSFYYKVVKASDYGLPQLRPRTFMIGFYNDTGFSRFEFPPEIPLKYDMSDVWGGKCSRKIGFTLRVGGRGSNISDRRNWDSYIVDGEVKLIMPEQAKKMQGFPNKFEFPVSRKEAMKQLGNSVAIDAIRICANAMVNYMFAMDIGENDMSRTRNKGEWTELYTFLKLINDRKVVLADSKLNTNERSTILNVTKVSTLNIPNSCYLLPQDQVRIKNEETGDEVIIDVHEFLNDEILNTLYARIARGIGSFCIEEFETVQNRLGISIIHGGTSRQKSDIVLDINTQEQCLRDEGFGIKSYIGNSPTLLNASGNNTNFLYKVDGLQLQHLDEINSINTRSQIADRLARIYEYGGHLEYVRTETETLCYNLTMVDSIMPELLSMMLLEFYYGRTRNIRDNIDILYANGMLSCFKNTDRQSFVVKIKRLLTYILLGFFTGTRWSGEYEAKGTIVVKQGGDQVGFHIMEIENLQNYLYENIKFDTPSTTRHRFGSLILEPDGLLYFKLNLQLRF